MTKTRARDEGADEDFVAWYRANHARILALVAAHSESRDDASDAVDEAFARAFAQWGRLQSMASPVGWVYVVAVNYLRRGRRRWRRFYSPSSSGVASRSAHSAPSAPAVTSDEIELERLLGMLTPRERDVATLVYVADLRHDDAARLLHVSRSTVSSTLANVRDRLRGQLENEDGVDNKSAKVPEPACGPPGSVGEKDRSMKGAE